MEERPGRGAEMQFAGRTLKKTSWLPRLPPRLNEIAICMKTADTRNALRPPRLHPVGQGMFFTWERLR